LVFSKGFGLSLSKASSVPIYRKSLPKANARTNKKTIRWRIVIFNLFESVCLRFF